MIRKIKAYLIRSWCRLEKISEDSLGYIRRKLRNAKRKAHKKGCPTAKLYTGLLKKHLRKAKRKWIRKKVDAKDPKSMWSAVKSLRAEGNSCTKNHYTINGEYLSKQETSERLVNFFSNIGGTPSHVDRDGVKQETSASCPVIHIGQVKRWLLDINTKKATCSRDSSAWITRMCAEDLCIPLCNIINNCFSCGIYPDIWKYAEIFPLEKCKFGKKDSDFRPISLLWHLGKILEKAIMHFLCLQFYQPLNRINLLIIKEKEL